MKRFEFRLQRVMDARESEKKQRQRALGDAQRQLGEAELVLKSLETELANNNTAQKKLTKGTAKISDLQVLDKWKNHLIKQISAQSAEVRRHQKAVEKRREELVEISREKKVLERLKEKKQEEHQKEMMTSQQNFLDEVGARNQQNHLS